MLYGVIDCPGCRGNFLDALAGHGPVRRDILPNINCFFNVSARDQAKLVDAAFVEISSDPDSYAALRAKANVLAVVSNSPKVNDPRDGGEPTESRGPVDAAARAME